MLQDLFLTLGEHILSVARSTKQENLFNLPGAFVNYTELCEWKNQYTGIYDVDCQLIIYYLVNYYR